MDGKILVSGGMNEAEPALQSTELYDPSTGMWTDASSMHYPREEHTATVLANGNVLVIGDWTDYSIAYTAELYNSTIDSYIPTDNMKNEQSSHKGFVLTNGDVLATGENNGTTFNNAEAH
jgi:hypothetical protein